MYNHIPYDLVQVAGYILLNCIHNNVYNIIFVRNKTETDASFKSYP